MRKYLSLAVVALSSGGALVAAAGAANAATANDNWRAAPWLSSSPLAHHAAPFGGHDDADALCLAQRDKITTGTVITDLKQKGCLTSGDMPMMTEHGPGHPPVMGPPPEGDPEPCPVACEPTPLTPPVMPPTTEPCPPGGDSGWMAPHSDTQAGATQAPATPASATPASATPAGTTQAPATQAGATQDSTPAAGNTMGGLPIVGSALGGLI